MRFSALMRIFAVVAALFLFGIFGLYLLVTRAIEFRVQAHRGQPIIRAIEQFHKQTGTYPVSLADLAPKYLPTTPDVPDQTQYKFSGWDYFTTTNGVAFSYSLRYYMGRGGVEYQPPVWYGNDEGHRTVILRND
jgi:hypothetical protein